MPFIFLRCLKLVEKLFFNNRKAAISIENASIVKATHDVCIKL